ncbi:hypothetical protein [Allorhizobium borbori]|uniref:Uncharacterized protein n=1 Tax=Allorhizobium borbori TaxID=485907 RepID=A0A7W6JZG2_9HYPH|nr:hypothetical protein [Allorhizobium borbori]MBB4102393.1 hypothetical protein [Allorhizobium borbori]
MAKKPETTPSENTIEPIVTEELYNATLTRTVKHDGRFHWPGTVFSNIGVDFASELQSADAAVITAVEIAEVQAPDEDPVA